MTIGQRIAQAIADRAKENGTTIRSECEKLQISEGTRHFWKRGTTNPSACVVAEMYCNGYDIHYILTGEGEDYA